MLSKFGNDKEDSLPLVISVSSDELGPTAEEEDEQFRKVEPKKRKRTVSVTTNPKPKRPQVQFRIGKNHWEMLCSLNIKLRELDVLSEEFHKFIRQKSNPKEDYRVNLAEIDEESLRKLNQCLFDRLCQTGNFDHLAYVGELPPRACRNPDNRLYLPVTDLNGVGHRVGATAVILYFNPVPCYEQDELGRYCGKPHRTVFEYSKSHPNYKPGDLHISHLCHWAPCLNRTHLLIEPAIKNLIRNQCRRECSCGNAPQCFTDSI